MSNDQPDWVNYWNNIAPKLGQIIDSIRNHEAEDYLTKAYGYFSFKIETLEKEITKHRDLFHSVIPMITQVHDMLRSNIVCQQDLLLSVSAFNLRVAFEIRANLLYTYNHDDPALMLKRLSDFFQYEQLSGRKQLGGKHSPDPKEEALFAKKHPYWEDKKCKGTLRIGAKWNGEEKTLYKICDFLSKKEKYKSMLNDFHFQYAQGSIFIHGSPLTKNIYTHPKHGITSIPQSRHVVINTVRGTHIMMLALEDFMQFFGVSYKETDFALIHHHFMKVQETLKVGVREE